MKRVSIFMIIDEIINEILHKCNSTWKQYPVSWLRQRKKDTTKDKV